MNYQDRIRALREDNDLTQTKAAEIVRVGQRTYSDYERGKTRMAIESLMALAEYYDVNMDYICGLIDEKSPYPRR